MMDEAASTLVPPNESDSSVFESGKYKILETINIRKVKNIFYLLQKSSILCIVYEFRKMMKQICIYISLLYIFRTFTAFAQMHDPF